MDLSFQSKLHWDANYAISLVHTLATKTSLCRKWDVK